MLLPDGEQVEKRHRLIKVAQEDGIRFSQKDTDTTQKQI